MRGKPARHDGALREGGITPAHAGKTQNHSSIPMLHWDHPRACGENPFLIFASKVFIGSPPRMRGKLASALSTLETDRITPAHAGKTNMSLPIPAVFKDHPRACGENGLETSVKAATIGSPPRMRGKRTGNKRQGSHDRITPAHAGKTLTAPPQEHSAKDHPRACGENFIDVETDFHETGSPPRMRGKLKYYGTGCGQQRITPAHAGKTLVEKTALAAEKDHPRACGENFRGGRSMCWEEGSPPRMRGKQLEHAYAISDPRITPAHAGKT